MQMNPCACMGPRGNDPHCPCKMYAMGLEPTPVKPMTEKERETFKKVLREIIEPEKFKFRTFRVIDK